MQRFENLYLRFEGEAYLQNIISFRLKQLEDHFEAKRFALIASTAWHWSQIGIIRSQ